MNFFLGTTGSWAGLGWIKNSWLLSWVLVEWASMTIVLYIGLGALIDFCTIVKYPFPSPIRSTLNVLETQVSHQRSSTEDEWTTIRLTPIPKVWSCTWIMFWAMCFCVLFLRNLLFSFSSPKYRFNDQWQEFHQNYPLQEFFGMTCVSSCLHTYLTMTCSLFLSRNKIPNSTELGAGGNLGWSCVRIGSQDVENRWGWYMLVP